MPFAESLLNIAHQFPMVQMRLFLSQFPRGVTGGKDQLFSKANSQPPMSWLIYPIHGTRTAIFAVPKRGNPIWLQHWSNRGVPESQIHFELFQESEKPVPHNSAVKTPTVLSTLPTIQ